jgi:hypothetical protein
MQSRTSGRPNDFSDKAAVDRQDADPRVMVQLKALIKACIAKPAKRIGDMTEVVRQLGDLARNFSPATSDETAVQLAEAQKQLTALKLSEFAAMQRKTAAEAKAPKLMCCDCLDEYDAIDGVTCCGPSSHFRCNACFSSMVHIQISGACKASFIRNHSKIECTICQQDGHQFFFDMQKITPRLTSETYIKYLNTLAEPAVINAQREAEERFERRLLEAQARMAKESSDAAISSFVKHIQDNLIQPRCPVPSCRVLVAGFDHCAHLTCGLQSNGSIVGGCGAHLCAWCMQSFPTATACQSHVHGCDLNANRPSLFPVESSHPRVWLEVQSKQALPRVKQ